MVGLGVWMRIVCSIQDRMGREVGAFRNGRLETGRTALFCPGFALVRALAPFLDRGETVRAPRPFGGGNPFLEKGLPPPEPPPPKNLNRRVGLRFEALRFRVLVNKCGLRPSWEIGKKHVLSRPVGRTFAASVAWPAIRRDSCAFHLSLPFLFFGKLGPGR